MEQITGENIEQITEDLRETVRGAREEVDQTQENLAVVVNVLVRTAAEVSERQTVVVVDEQVRSLWTHICMRKEILDKWIFYKLCDLAKSFISLS